MRLRLNYSSRDRNSYEREYFRSPSDMRRYEIQPVNPDRRYRELRQAYAYEGPLLGDDNDDTSGEEQGRRGKAKGIQLSGRVAARRRNIGTWEPVDSATRSRFASF